VPARVRRGMRDLIPDGLRVVRASLSEVGGVRRQKVRSVGESETERREESALLKQPGHCTLSDADGDAQSDTDVSLCR
jgi:hypothetical protein